MNAAEPDMNPPDHKVRPMPKLVPIALAVLITSPAAAFATTASYICEDKTQIMAVFSPPGVSPGSVSLTLDGAAEPVVLPQQLSADGGRYANDEIEFWIKGRDATFTRDGRAQPCSGQ
jgi:membrane-bound inhibitor of C-type lysozyme